MQHECRSEVPLQHVDSATRTASPVPFLHLAGEHTRGPTLATSAAQEGASTAVAAAGLWEQAEAAAGAAEMHSSVQHCSSASGTTADAACDDFAAKASCCRQRAFSDRENAEPNTPCLHDGSRNAEIVQSVKARTALGQLAEMSLEALYDVDCVPCCLPDSAS